MNDSSVPGECPECNEVLKYNEIEVDDNNLYRECECLGCGWSGKEWFQLTFVAVIGNDVNDNEDVYDLDEGSHLH